LEETMRRLFLFGAVGAALFILAGCSENSPMSSDAGGQAAPGVTADNSLDAAPTIQSIPGPPNMGVPAWATTYEVTLENLTPATGPGASQPFSPPVLATHQRGERIFRLSRPASEELAMVAEDAMNGPLVAMLQASNKVADVTEGTGVILPGASDQFTIMAGRGAQFLSLAFMLVNTNDGFGAADGIKLPAQGERTYTLYAYDAGSELNDELASHIPGPCCGSPGQGISEDEVIRMHAGILGVGDLDPATYGWTDPVARLTVTRVK
jgi:hypothetical protein